MTDCCEQCSDNQTCIEVEQRYRHLLNVERCGCFMLGALIGASVAGIAVMWFVVTYLK